MNSLGDTIIFTSFGESHGAAIGGVLDGVPAGMVIDMVMIRDMLDRRAGRSGDTVLPGVSSRARAEADEVEWLSGVLDGETLGTPIAFLIRNDASRPDDYQWLRHSYRPGHADFSYEARYGLRDGRGGGRASARETASRVVAGSIARQMVKEQGICIQAALVQVGDETDPTRFEDLIDAVSRDGDSIGGIVQCTVSGLKAGWGDPIFDKVQSHLAYAMLSINGCKGFDYGSGFAQAAQRGSTLYLNANGSVRSDCTGGLAGGITDGSTLVFRCAFKPTPSSRKTLEAIAPKGQAIQGRFDVCIAVRAIPVVEAMTALVLADILATQH